MSRKAIHLLNIYIYIYKRVIPFLIVSNHYGSSSSSNDNNDNKKPTPQRSNCAHVETIKSEPPIRYIKNQYKHSQREMAMVMMEYV